MSQIPNDANSLTAYLRGPTKISKDDILAWMRSHEIEMLGALYHAISDGAVVQRIEPALSKSEAQGFLRSYFGRCVRENPSGEWANSRYSAAWDAAGWLNASWSSLSEIERSQWKKWIAGLYREGDAPIREALETGLLEHIFPTKQIAKYFSDWEQESDLREGYRMSLSVARGTFPPR